MTTLELTQEQVDAIRNPVVVFYEERERIIKAQAAKPYAALQRRTDARIEKAKRETKEWKEHYKEARKNLIAARNEITILKRKLRNGEWE